jgi:hypothetical protein
VEAASFTAPVETRHHKAPETAPTPSLCDAISTGQVALSYCAGDSSQTSLRDSSVTNPASAGWTRVQPKTDSSLKERGMGCDKSGACGWRVDDATTARGATLFYKSQVDAAAQAKATKQGWTLAARVKTLSTDDGTSGTQSVGYTTVNAQGSTVQYGLIFDIDAAGTLTVNLVGENGGLHTVTDADNFHTYQIETGPDGSAKLLVDGKEVARGWKGRALKGKAAVAGQVIFGASSSAGKGSALYNKVEFAVNQ